MRRIPVFGILLAILLGVVTTIAVAWGLACRDWNVSRFRQERWHYEWLRDEGEALILHLNWRIGQSVGVATERRMSRIPEEESMFGRRVAAPPAFLLPHLRGIDLDLQSSAVCHASGWPMLALHEDTLFLREPTGGTNQVRRVERGSLDVRLPHIGNRQLPILPVWRGLVVDTLLYGSAWLAILIAPGIVRRRIRRRRGLCIHCRYDLRGHGHTRCPECGHEISFAQMCGR